MTWRLCSQLMPQVAISIYYSLKLGWGRSVATKITCIVKPVYKTKCLGWNVYFSALIKLNILGFLYTQLQNFKAFYDGISLRYETKLNGHFRTKSHIALQGLGTQKWGGVSNGVSWKVAIKTTRLFNFLLLTTTSTSSGVVVKDLCYNVRRKHPSLEKPMTSF